MEPGPLDRRGEQLAARKELLDALEALDEILASDNDDCVEVSVQVSAVFMGQIKSAHSVTTRLIPDDKTDLVDVANITMEGAKVAIRDMINDVQAQYEKLREEREEEDE